MRHTGQLHNDLKLPKRLFARIIKRLKIEKNLVVLKKRLSFSSVALMISVILLALAVIFFIRELSESEFSPFLSLIFSDTKATLLYWQDLILSILESMPSFNIVAVLSALLILMGSLRFFVRYLDRAALLLKLIRK